MALDVNHNNKAELLPLATSNPSSDPAWSLDAMQIPPKANSSGPSDLLQDFFGIMDQALTPSSTDGMTDFDDLSASSMAYSLDMNSFHVDPSANTILDLSSFFPTSFDGSSDASGTLFDTLTGYDDPMPGLSALPTPSFTPSSLATPPRETGASHQQETQLFDPPCSCLIEALGLMKQLISPPGNSCPTSAPQNLDKTTFLPPIHTVIAQNEAAVDAVSRMLKCSCSQDGYLLAVMSLIIFKVLGWYATVACCPQGSPADDSPGRSRSSSCSEQDHWSKPTVVGNYRLDGEDSARMASQLVLSELHRVRQLVEQLSLKLKGQAVKTERAGTETPESMDLDSEMTPPLSAGMFDQLEADLRKRMKTLSWKILEQLRRL